MLAEQALPKGEVTQAIYDQMVADAEAALKTAQADAASDDGKAVDAAKALSDTVAIGAAIGLTTRV